MHNTTHPRRAILWAALVVLLMPLAVLTGCTTYGSKKVDAQIITLPANVPAHVFLVSLEAWAQITQVVQPTQPYTPQNKTWFQQQLEPYRASTEGNSKHHVNALPYQTICVVESRGRYWWAKIKLEENKKFTIPLDE